MIKIDVKDKKLIYFLTQDARLSDSQLARKAGLSKSAARYRIKRLEDEGIIESYITVINFGPIAYDSFDFFIRFNCAPEREQAIVSALAKKTYSIWVAALSGEWDLLLEVRTNTQEHLTSIINDILDEFGQDIDTYYVQMGAEIYKVDHLVHDFKKGLYPETTQQKTRVFSGTHELDSIEKKLLYNLSQNSRSSLHELAGNTNTTVDVVRYRMNKLEEKNIILSYIAVVNVAKLGYTEYIITLDLRNISASLLHKLRLRLIGHENVKYCFRGGLSPQIIMLTAFTSSDDLTNFLKSIKSEFHNMISVAKHLLIKKHYKFTLFPG